jgi:hypothetical protein
MFHLNDDPPLLFVEEDLDSDDRNDPADVPLIFPDATEWHFTEPDPFCPEYPTGFVGDPTTEVIC